MELYDVAGIVSMLDPLAGEEELRPELLDSLTSSLEEALAPAARLDHSVAAPLAGTALARALAIALRILFFNAELAVLAGRSDRWAELAEKIDREGGRGLLDWLSSLSREASGQVLAVFVREAAREAGRFDKYGAPYVSRLVREALSKCRRGGLEELYRCLYREAEEMLRGTAVNKEFLYWAACPETVEAAPPARNPRLRVLAVQGPRGGELIRVETPAGWRLIVSQAMSPTGFPESYIALKNEGDACVLSTPEARLGLRGVDCSAVERLVEHPALFTGFEQALYRCLGGVKPGKGEAGCRRRL